MSRIALVAPGHFDEYSVNEPLNLGYIAGFLEKNGVDVKIIDQLAGHDVKKELSKFSPDVVGITATTPVINIAYEIADWCKKKGIKTVIGGVHASLLPEEALIHADIVVKGEGELAMLDIIEKDIRSGLVEGQYIKNLDEIPPPARHLIDMDFYLSAADRFPGTYLSFVPPKTKVASVLTSRGCPYSCAFCHNSWKGLPYRFNSPERVLSELKSLKNDYGAEAIFFIEDNFFANKKRVAKICNLIIKENIDIIWAANSRVNNVDREILQLAKDAGCKQITFGFESGSQRILDILNKKIIIDQSINAIKLCKSIGLLVNGTVMVGNPTETIEDIEMTQNFIRDNEVDSIGVCFTTPFPGTKIWHDAKEKGLLPDHFNWDDLALNTPKYSVCDTIPFGKLKKLYYKTLEIANQKSKKPIPFQIFLNWCLNNPYDAIKQCRNPKEILRNLKRLKI